MTDRREIYNERNKAKQKEIRRLAKLALDQAEVKIEHPLTLNFRDCPPEILEIIKQLVVNEGESK